MWVTSSNSRVGRIAATTDSLSTHLTTLHFSYWWLHREKHVRSEFLTKSRSTLEKCISRESNPGHIDGNDVFYH